MAKRQIERDSIFSQYDFTVTERFCRYVRIDTQSDPQSNSFPSTDKQKVLSELLVKELQELGIVQAELDKYGYVYATLPSNSEEEIPVICFCAHVDTSSDCSGAGVEPIIHRNYDGKDIVLPQDTHQIIRVADHPYLRKKMGEDIITASGTTLLGADDKSGVAVIMDMVHFFSTHPHLKHGTIKILFTPDEEIGRGVDKVDLKKLGADYGYTLDGGELGTLEDETFSADAVTVTFLGTSVHPGYAKGKMVNAIKLAAAFLESLPKGSLSPENTEGREGFVHPVQVSGIAEKASVELIVRDFVTAKLKEYEFLLQQKVDETLLRYPGAVANVEIKEQYRNMKEVLDNYPLVNQNAVEAIKRAGLDPVLSSARGGTDGSRLSFMGLPCPNLFTGEMAFHGKHEYISVQDMQKSVETIVHLAMIWEEQG